MPAPQASMMQQLARAKFMSFGLVVPTNWVAPVGEAAEQYAKAFKEGEMTTTPGSPPLFIPASLNKYHTDVQKMHIATYGAFIDGTCSAICSAWAQWQSAASMTGIIINAVTAAGGQVVGPPLQPLILATAPKGSPMIAKYSNVIASVISAGWLTFTATIKVPGLPWYPLFAAMASPVAPPTPNIPAPFAQLVQVPVSITCAVMKMQMIAQLADPQAPYHKELFESICDAFEKCYTTWKATTMVTNVLGTGPVPTFAPPIVPVGPVVAGFGTMAPGGFV